MIKDIRKLIYGYLTFDEKEKIKSIGDPILYEQIIEDISNMKYDTKIFISEYNIMGDIYGYGISLTLNNYITKIEFAFNNFTSIPKTKWKELMKSIMDGMEASVYDNSYLIIYCNQKWIGFKDDNENMEILIDREKNKDEMCKIIEKIIEKSGIYMKE